MLRRRRGTWTADTLRSERKPQGIRLAYGASSGVLSALTVLHDANSATEQSHLQLATFGEDWRDARVIATSNLGALSPSLAPLGDTFVASWSTWKPPGFESSTIAWVRVGRDGRVVRGRAVSHGENSFPFEMFVVDNAHPIWLYRTDPPGRAIVATATDTMPLSLGTITVPFDNFKVSSTPIDRARVLAFTTKVGKAPDEPMGALYATVLEFRCPGSAQR
jgi:hypothetical protein